MRLKIILSALSVLTLAACTKDNSPTERPMLQDGPLSAELGKLIYLGDHGYSRSTPFWGRNSNELFITASTEILRVDIAEKKIEVVENTGGMVIGKTNENSGVIFIGKINKYGYYVFNFSTNSTEKIIEVPTNQATLLNIAGNNIFYFMAQVSTPNPPCNGFCVPLPGPFVPATFYHLDKVTQKITDLKNKQFLLFSLDGSKTILSSQLESRMYVFDNNSRIIIDSSDVNSNAFSFGLFFYSGVLHSFEQDVFRNITIKNFNTGQVVRQYQSIKPTWEEVKVSSDGTKLYYSGGIFNGNSQMILLYDIATNTEKIISDVPNLPGGTMPFGIFVLSDDNKKMITQAGNDLYLKLLD